MAAVSYEALLKDMVYSYFAFKLVMHFCAAGLEWEQCVRCARTCCEIAGALRLASETTRGVPTSVTPRMSIHGVIH